MSKPKSKEFIESDSDDSSSDVQPAKKKSKKETKKESKPESKKPAGSDDAMMEIGKLRYVSVSDFRGRKYVNIREYYEKDGEIKPGKKGIALTSEQWNRLKDCIEDIDKAL